MTDAVIAGQDSTPEAVTPEQSQQVETIPEKTTAPEQSSQEDPADDAAAEAKKHKGGFQRRIDDLTRQREEERREKERLLALVEHLTGRKGEQPEQQVNRDAEPKRESFDSYEDYLEARAEWKAEQAANKRLADAERAQEEKARRATQEQRVREWSTKLEATRAKYADFDDITATADVPVTPAMSEAIMESDVGPEIAYYLGKNPAEARRIALLSPLSQAREIGRLEGQVSKPAKASNAPAPIKPVGTRSAGSDPLSDNLPMSQWGENFRKLYYGKR